MPNKLTTIKMLVNLANHLDKKGLHKEADSLDTVIEKIYKVAEDGNQIIDSEAAVRISGKSSVDQVNSTFDSLQPKNWQENEASKKPLPFQYYQANLSYFIAYKNDPNYVYRYDSSSKSFIPYKLFSYNNATYLRPLPDNKINLTNYATSYMNLVNGLNNLLKGAPSNIINTPTATAAKVIIDYNQLTKPSAAPAAAEVAPPSTTAPVASPSTEVAPAANTTQTTENGPANSSNYIIAEQGSNGAAVKLIHDALIKLQPRSIKQDAFNSSMAGQLSGYYLLTDYPANKYGDETVGAINLFQFKMNYPGPNMGKVDTQTWDLLFNEKNESKRKAAFPPPVVRTQVPLQFENATEITSPESEEE